MLISVLPLEHFQCYLKERFADSDITGYEFLEESVSAGNELFPNLNLIQADILDTSYWDNKQYDVVTMLGVLCIFDDIKLPLPNIRKNAQKKWQNLHI